MRIKDWTPLITQQDKDTLMLKSEDGFPEKLVVIGKYAKCVLADVPIVDAIFLYQGPILATNVVKVTLARVFDRVLAITITCTKDRAATKFFFNKLRFNEDLWTVVGIHHNQVNGSGLTAVFIEDVAVFILEHGA